MADFQTAARWTLPVGHLSASSLNMLQRCPEQYRQRYLLGRKERPNVSLTMGDAFHGAVEHNLTQKIDSCEDLLLDEVVEFYNDEAWPAAIEKGGGAEEIDWRDSKPEGARFTGRQMVAAYHTAVAPRVQPESVEQRFELHDLLPVPVIGFTDVVQPTTIVDLKTSGRRVKRLKPGWRLQDRVYKLAYPGRAVDWHVVTSTTAPEVITPLEEPELYSPTSPEELVETQRMLRRLAQMANALYATFGPDEPWPTTGTHHDCCSWCGYRKGCVAWS